MFRRQILRIYYSDEVYREGLLIFPPVKIVPVYTYKATNSHSNIVRGTIAGNSPREVREVLRNKGMSILELDPQAATTNHLNRLPTLSRSQYVKEVATSSGELGTLLSVGVPLLESLDTLIQQYDRGFKTILMHVRDDVVSGSSLADAMRRHPRVFDALAVSMVDVGENTGKLDVVLQQLSDFKTRSLEFKDRILSSLMYPFIVLFVATLVMIFLMVFVVPMLLENLLDAGQEIPWPTQVLKFFSDLAVTHWWWLSIFTATFALFSVLYFRSKHGGRVWYWMIDRIPLVGDLSKKQEISRVALVVGTLMNSGVSFLNSVDIASRTTKNKLLSEALDACHERVETGKDIGEAMEVESYFPPMVVQIFSVGQKSGHLEDMLFRLSKDYDNQVQTATNRLQSVLEPILIVVLSIFVGFILFATLLPIMEAGNVLSNK